MGLLFNNAVSDRVLVAASAAIDDFTEFTTMLWCRPTSFTTGGRRLFVKGPDTQRKTMNWTATTLLDSLVHRATTNAVSTSSTTFSTNTWYCISMTYSEAAGSKLYWGTLTTAQAEVSYGTNTVGVGSTLADSTGVFVWGNLVSAAASMPGQIAWGAYFNAILSAADRDALQRFPYKAPAHTNCVMMHSLGHSTAGTQMDFRGAADGTITGATLSIHVPRITHPALM